jgi:ATP-dependent Clp protease ATP-binding subunit ClpC
MSDRFTQKAENALNNSVTIAEGLGHTYIGSEHILLALAEDELSCAALILKKNDISKEKISSLIREYSGTGVKSSLSSKDLTPRARKILESSYNNAIQYGDGMIGTEHILLSLIEERDSVAIKLLKNARADLGAIKDDIYTLIKSRERSIQKTKKDAYSPILKQYGKNLCELAKEGKFDPVIGRKTETDRVVRVLSRKSKNNPCLVGEAGVGKTAIIEGLAQRIVNNDVPAILKGKTIISLDLTSMVAGAKYRGDFEERIKNIINEVVKHKDIILFIDEIHTIVGAGAAEGAIDAANILKPQLARGDLQIIGATTLDEYRRYIEKDAALERRFQPIRINEPTESETVAMLMALKERYEEHHGVRIEEGAIRECVALSCKYINDRFLPDKAIDILDEACAMSANKTNNFNKSNIILEQYAINKDIRNLSALDIKEICEAEYPIRSMDKEAEERPRVTEATIRDVISEACEIPASMVKKSIDYDELEKRLNETVLGQNNAIKRLVSVIKRYDMGFGKSSRPRGVFMFVGESGVGKTALATELEKSLYYDTAGLLRFDMSEYSERQSISKLIGSPPGYVGHEDGGTLTEAVRKRPNSVILFDEIEKADKEIMNILLQISDYGYLTDSAGRRVSFKNAIIIATTNIGTSHSTDVVGFKSTSDRAKDYVTALKKYYKDEFINRFDEIIAFAPLEYDTLKSIVAEKLNELSASLSEKGYEFQYTDAVLDHIVSSSRARGLGARPILRYTESLIDDKIIDLLISSDDELKSINAEVQNERIIVTLKNALKTS